MTMLNLDTYKAKHYSTTWLRNTELMRLSLDLVNEKNFHLASSFAGLYDRPCPFRYRKKTQTGKQPRGVIHEWYQNLKNYIYFEWVFVRLRNQELFKKFSSFLPSEDNPPLRFDFPFYKIHAGRKFNGMFLKAAEQLHHLKPFIEKRPLYACEIGAGFGAMCEAFVKEFQPKAFFIIDLPETLQISRLYLNRVFPSRVISAQQWTNVKAHDDKAWIVQIVCHDFQILKDLAPQIDVFLNCNSFSEMDTEQLEKYFRLIESYPNVILSQSNPKRQEGETLHSRESLPYANGWAMLYEDFQQFPYWKSNYQVISRWKGKGNR